MECKGNCGENGVSVIKKQFYFIVLMSGAWLPKWKERNLSINPLTPNDPYRGRTAPLTSKCCILYIYSTNIGTEYFKHGVYTIRVFSLKCSLFHNSNVFGSCIIHILYAECAKIKKNNSGAKRLRKSTNAETTCRGNRKLYRKGSFPTCSSY